MIDTGKRNVLGVLVNAIDYDGAIARIIDAAKKGQPLSVTALAVHGVMTGVLDSTHRHRLNRIDIVTPDGQPVRWATNLLYKSGLSERVYGPELMIRLCERAADEQLPIYLFGADEVMLGKLKKRLVERFPRIEIAGARPSKFRTMTAEERDEFVADVNASGAKLMLVGLGCPRQEVFVYEMRDAVGIPMLAIGAAFAFHGESLPQAPGWMQKRGLEWLFRLIQEPRRLWKRYLLLNPMYASLLGLQFAGLKNPDPEQTKEPVGEVRYG